jgi:phage terminase large subunit
MEIEFSEVYQPLFDLLEARNVVNDKSFSVAYNSEEQKYWLDLSKVDIVLCSGGRDSGKTFSISSFNCVAANDYNHRVLYTRFTMSSAGNSIAKAVDNRLNMLNYTNDFNITANEYVCKDGDGLISITGQKTSSGEQTAKLKSIEDYTIFVTDEGEELPSKDEFTKVKRSIRGKGVQTFSIISFNPPTMEHWMYDEWYADVPDGFCGVKNNILYIHSTYLDNGKENMTEALWREYDGLRKDYELWLRTPEKLKKTLHRKCESNYKDYKYTILGGFKLKAEGVVLTNWSIGGFNPDNLQTYFGQDYGFSNDPTTLVEVAIDRKHKKIYAKELLYKAGLQTSQIADINIKHCGKKLIVGDSAEPRLISELQAVSNILPAKKGQGSITAGVMILQDYEIVVTSDSVNLIKEFNNHVYADKGSKTYQDDWNHLIDALRYIVFYILNNNSSRADMR